MWEWREERGRWRLDDSGSWNWDEPSLLDRVGSAPFGAAGPRRPSSNPMTPPVPPVPPPGPWVPPEPWRRGPVRNAWPTDRSEPVEPRGPRDPWDGPWLPGPGPAPADAIPVTEIPTAELLSEETPIFAAVAEDHERDESTGGKRLRPSRHGVPDDGHRSVDERHEYRTAPAIPEPSPGSGPFPVPGGSRSVPAARHARNDGVDRPDDASARLDGRHALRR